MTATFLGLPVSVREQIYFEAGVYVRTRHQWPFSPTYCEDYIKPEEQSFTTTLCSVCRQMRDEVEVFVLANNTLVYAEESLELGLEYLAKLRPEACARLRHLDIILFTDNRNNEGEYVYPDMDWDIIPLWEAACTNVLTHATPKTLELRVLCNTGLCDVTDAIIAPLEPFPGHLDKLYLLLHEYGAEYYRGSHYWEALYNLTRKVVVRAEGHDPRAPPKKPFRFFDLPPEVRRIVYEHTELAAPHDTIHWTPRIGFYVQPTGFYTQSPGRFITGLPLCPDHDENDLLGTCETNETFRRFCYDGYDERKCLETTYCTYSPRCVHYRGALPLLLVNRAMYAEAIDFFYRHNRIVVMPSDRTATPFNNCPVTETYAYRDSSIVPAGSIVIDRDATKCFLNSIGPTNARRLHTLEIVFPRVEGDLYTATGYIKQWHSAVSYLVALSDQEQPRDLTLSVHFWTVAEKRPAAPTTEFGPFPSLTDMRFAVAKQYLWPLIDVSHLKKLYVHLEFMHHWSPTRLARAMAVCEKRKLGGFLRTCWDYLPGEKKVLRDDEVRLEKMIMGSDYDSFAVGKDNEMPSQWLRAAWARLASRR